jgi:hypothetical protein
MAMLGGSQLAGQLRSTQFLSSGLSPDKSGIPGETAVDSRVMQLVQREDGNDFGHERFTHAWCSGGSFERRSSGL